MMLLGEFMQQDEPQYELVKVDFGGDSLSQTSFVVLAHACEAAAAFIDA